uniref:Amino acid transporter transmembrane domain-containing protein n=1 Tax=Anopheles culicifacies TaxID=139723 RepID=A0A182MCC9_9DIPT
MAILKHCSVEIFMNRFYAGFSPDPDLANFVEASFILSAHANIATKYLPCTVSFTMTVDKGHTNTAFVGDEAINGKKPPQAKTIDPNMYTLEIQEKKPGLETEYDPYQHRHVEHPTTNNETLIHLLKGSLGTGILAMPNAFHHAGWTVGVVGTLLIGLLCTYCIHLLIKAEHELCKRKRVPSLNYPAVTQTALLEGPDALKPLSKVIIHIVNVFLLIYQLGTCCVYVVFVSSNIKAIADYYTETDTDVRLYMLIILLPLILINWVRNLKFLAPFSTIANFVTLVSFGIILYYIFREPISFEDRDKVGTMSGFALFFGTVLFALEAIGVILPLENEMKTPKKFGGNFGVLNKAMILIVTLYVGMGFFGYLNYGSAIKGSITLNLPEGEILAQCVKGMLAFAIYITHGLACYVAIDITWNDYLKKNLGDSPRSVFYEYIARTVLVLITCTYKDLFSTKRSYSSNAFRLITVLLAVAIPNLELFISLFGALCLSALGIAFPALIQTCTYWHHRQGMAKVWMVTKNSIIGVIAILGLVIGTSTSMIEIIHTFGHDD